VKEDRNDMAYWFPRLLSADVPVPRTTLIEAPPDLVNILDGVKPEGYDEFIAKLTAAAYIVGDATSEHSWYAFLRTGHTSNKHSWGKTCFLESPGFQDMRNHVFNLVEFSECADILGLPCRTWAVREFVPLWSTFTAFDGLPIAVERRVFIKDGKPLCDHNYWPPLAIRNPSREDWQSLLRDHDEIARLYDSRTQINAYLDRICSAFDGSWSVDFALGRDGVWRCIDLAEGDRSFHWPGCPHAPKSDLH
jgi:hypothetical protein